MKSIHVAAVPEGWGVFRGEIETFEDDYGFLLDLYKSESIAFDAVAEMYEAATSGRLPLNARVIERFEQYPGSYLWIHNDPSIVRRGQA